MKCRLMFILPSSACSRFLFEVGPQYESSIVIVFLFESNKFLLLLFLLRLSPTRSVVYFLNCVFF